MLVFRTNQYLTCPYRLIASTISPSAVHLIHMTSPLRKRPSRDDGSVSPPPSKRPFKQPSTTTSKVVSNFFLPTSQKAKIPEKVSWRTIDSSLIVGQYNGGNPPCNTSGKRKVAAFDFDSTLISTISKLKFSKDANDWCWWHGSVPAKLKSLHEDGYTLIVVSNQNGINLKPSTTGPKITKNDRFTHFKQKATAVFTALDLPITLYAATEKDQYRKPATGMWNRFLQDHGLKAEDIDLANSIFVGDAGGRIAGAWNGKSYKSDFSCSDRNFATNVGLDFHTPEEYFLDEAPREFVRTFDPASYLAAMDRLPFQKASTKEVIVFVGFPGSGKSTFFKRNLEPLGYERVNQDILKSRDKCIKHAADYLSQGKSVAVDNTNPDQEVRKVWTSFAQKHSVPIRCVHFTASKELARHNAAVRARSGLVEMNPETRENLPDLAFNSFAARFQEPKVEESFSEIITLDFNFVGTEEGRAIWSKYWI